MEKRAVLWLDILINLAFFRDHKAIIRFINLVKSKYSLKDGIIRSIYSWIGSIHLIKITRNPGTGKNRSVDKMIHYFFNVGRSIGIIIVDSFNLFYSIKCLV